MSDLGTRSHLLSLLSEACELEHALACSYLFAAFSLKNGQADGLEWREEQTVRRWAAQTYFVASQEMLHLAQAWNLAVAVGGAPYFSRPPFPQPKGYLPIDAQLTLERFSAPTLDRFLQWEAPSRVAAERRFVRGGVDPLEAQPYRTVGELYGRIEEALQSLPEPVLFVGDPDLQVGSELADFPDLVRVTDRASASRAIARIRTQGEGSPDDREDCHFGVFHDMRVELDALSSEPAHPVLANPSRSPSPGTRRVVDVAARDVMGFFDDLYATMLRLLGWVFGPGDPRRAWTRTVARAAIATMPVVLKPLGEALARLPSGTPDFTAGAPFSSMRHVPLPAEENLARRLVTERVTELGDRARALLRDHTHLKHSIGWLPGRLETVVAGLSR